MEKKDAQEDEKQQVQHSDTIIQEIIDIQNK